MQDASEQQNNAQFNQVLQSSPLSQRLVRRSTESLGVVHLKPFQSQYVRMPGWMVQRSALLEQLQTRYGVRQEGTGETPDMVLANAMPQPPQAQLNSALLPSSLGAMPPPIAPIRGKFPTPSSTSPPSHQYRVSRRVALPPDSASSPTVASSSISKGKTSEKSGEIEATQPSDSSSQSQANPVSLDTSEPILPNSTTESTSSSIPKISETPGEGGAEVSLVWRQVSSVPSEASLTSEFASSSPETLTQTRSGGTTATPGGISSSAQSQANTISPDTSEPTVRSLILPNSTTKNTSSSIPKSSETPGAGGAEVSLVWRQVSSVPSEASLTSEFASSSPETLTQTRSGGTTATLGGISSSAQSQANTISPDTSEPTVRSLILPNNISQNTPQPVTSISETPDIGGTGTPLILRKVASVQSDGLAEPLMLTPEQSSSLAENPTQTSGGNPIASEVKPHSSSSVPPKDAIAPSSPRLESPISIPGGVTEVPLVFRKAASVQLDDSLGQSIADKSLFLNNSEHPAASEKFPIAGAEISTQSSNLRGVAERTNVPLILRQAVSVKPDEFSKENAIAKVATLPPQVKAIGVSSIRTDTESPSNLVVQTDAGTRGYGDAENMNILRMNATSYESPGTLPLVKTATTSINLQPHKEDLSTATGVETPNSQRMAVAAEIPMQTTSLSQVAIVWRKSAHESSSGMPLGSQLSRGNQNALPLAINLRNGNEQIARQSISASSSMPQTTTEMGNSISADAGSVPRQVPASVREVNVAQIAEQVSRILSRQLMVERERRGMN